MIDLHIHSIYSDGSFSPSQLINLCNQKGINTISITDHDTIDAYVNMTIPKEYNVKVIPGIEFGLGHQDRCHILGYGFDLNSSIMKNACLTIKKHRLFEVLEIFRIFKKHNIEITVQDITSTYKTGLRLGNIIQELIRKGYAKDRNEVYDKFFRKEGKPCVTFYNYTPEEKINIIKKSNGKAILAHPYQLGLDKEKMEKKIVELINAGLDGLEIYHSGQETELEEFLLEMADKYHLLITGGSDFHGIAKPSVKIGEIYGGRTIPDDVIEKLGW